MDNGAIGATASNRSEFDGFGLLDRHECSLVREFSVMIGCMGGVFHVDESEEYKRIARILCECRHDSWGRRYRTDW